MRVKPPFAPRLVGRFLFAVGGFSQCVPFVKHRAERIRIPSAQTESRPVVCSEPESRCGEKISSGSLFWAGGSAIFFLCPFCPLFVNNACGIERKNPRKERNMRRGREKKAPLENRHRGAGPAQGISGAIHPLANCKRHRRDLRLLWRRRLCRPAFFPLACQAEASVHRRPKKRKQGWKSSVVVPLTGAH